MTIIAIGSDKLKNLGCNCVKQVIKGNTQRSNRKIITYSQLAVTGSKISREGQKYQVEKAKLPKKLPKRVLHIPT